MHTHVCSCFEHCAFKKMCILDDRNWPTGDRFCYYVHPYLNTKIYAIKLVAKHDHE